MAAAGFPAALQVYWHKEDPSLGVCILASCTKEGLPGMIHLLLGDVQTSELLGEAK